MKNFNNKIQILIKVEIIKSIPDIPKFDKLHQIRENISRPIQNVQRNIRLMLILDNNVFNDPH